MEFFTINYDEKFKNLLSVLEDLQEHLGDIHDCDVIEMTLTEYLRELPDREAAETEALGINALLFRYREMRSAKYQAFLQQWDALEASDFKKQFLEIITDENQ